MANDLDQSVSNAIAGGVSAPIDLIAWALRKAGVPGVEKPVLGSDWMREKGLTAPVKSQSAAIVGETIGNLLDPAAAAGKTAILLPFLAKNLREISRVVKAEDLAKQGATARDIWRETQLFKYPRTEGHVSQATWGHEVPRGMPVEDLTDVRNHGKSLEQVYHAPELYNAVPALRDVEFRLDPMDPAGGYYAHHEGPYGTVALAQVLQDPAGIPGVMSHEITHAANAHLNQLQSAGAGIHPVRDPSILQYLSQELRKDPRKEKFADIIDRLPAPTTTDINDAAYLKHWGHDMGERLAEASRIRDARSPDLNRVDPPHKYFYRGLEAPSPSTPLNPSDISFHAYNATNLDPPDALAYFLRSIRDKYK